MISTEQYRAAIGTYSHGRPKQSHTTQTIVISKSTISLSIRLVLFSLLTISGSVESNPGPSNRELEAKVTEMESRMSDLEERLQKMTENCVTLGQACLHLEEVCERLESQSRRDNVIIHNLPIKEDGGETWSESEQKAKDHFKEMGITEEIQIERAHRLNAKKPSSPVIVKLSSYKQREKIIEKAKQIKREKRQKNQPKDENEAYTIEDFTNRVRKCRALLRPGLMEAIKANKRAFISYDKLVIDGKIFWYDETKNELSENKPSVMCCSDISVKLGQLI